MTAAETLAMLDPGAGTAPVPGLAQISALLAGLGHPERALRFVHITGTNGKGSTAALTASMLRAAGYRTGLFTSPHLWSVHERMQVDGVPIPDGELGALAREVLDLAQDMVDQPTVFQRLTALGLEWFRRRGCDFVVLEVGLGGRLDATNAIPAPQVAAITPIGLEHTRELGDTIAQIAREKAGIVKPGCHAVLSHQGATATQAVRAACTALQVPLMVTQPQKLTLHHAGPEGQTFSYRGHGPYHIALLGPHQRSNAITALEIVYALRQRGWAIPETAVVQGLAHGRWPGRLELVRRGPDLIVDGGHNPQCAHALMTALEELWPGRKLIFLTGVLADKDYPTMLRRAAVRAKFFVAVTPPTPRGLPAQALAALLSGWGLPVTACDTVAQGVDAALAMAGPEDVICAWGSLYSVGEIRHHLGLC